LQQELGGDLDRVEKIVKLFGIVQSTDDFKEQHKVLNGCSDLLVEVFGEERGLHARSAIGTNCLPLDISVEVEAIVQIKPLS
jgi:enamine deaminase RidA (YjgF/YER057c/UK114 family)